METGNQPVRAQEELAREIYVRLVGSSFEAVEGKLRAKSDALARLSLQLAADFYQSKESVETAGKPKTAEFNLDTLMMK